MNIKEIKKRGREWRKSSKKLHNYEDVISNINDYSLMELQEVHHMMCLMIPLQDGYSFEEKKSTLKKIIESRIRENIIKDILNE